MGLFSSFESKTIKIAMGALQETANMVPENSTEYFPAPAEMKARKQQENNRDRHA